MTIVQKDITASDGVNSCVRLAGSATRALIFVHGVGSTAAIWDYQLQELATDFTCVAIELRGNGIPKPEPSPDAITRHGYALDVIAAMDELNIARADFIGCSLGGVVGFELAGMAPERFSSMTILGSFACYPDAQAYTQRVIGAVQAAGSMADFAEQRAAQLGLPSNREAETISQMACKSIASYEAATQVTWTGDYRDRLAHIELPTLVTYGQRDTVAPRALSEEIANGIQNARLVEIPDAGHVANADNPSFFNALLREFLATVEDATHRNNNLHVHRAQNPGV